MPPISRLLPLLTAICLVGACSIKLENTDASAQAAVNGDDPGSTAVVVETVPASRRAMAAHYTGTAALEARSEAQVVARTSGVALAVLVEEGQAVKAGQALVHLDPDQATLRVEQSRAQMDKLDNSYRRALQLVTERMVSQTDVDQLKFDLDSARAQYEAAELELSYTTVTAPMAGVVASRDVKPGNFVQIYSPIIRIVDQHHLEATLNVPEREIARITPGQTVALSADALPGQRFHGTVARVSPVVDAGTGTFRVVCAFSGNGGLQPGMFGRLDIQYEARADALAVPRTALLDEGGEIAVYVVNDGRARRTPLTLGTEEAGWVEVRSGLKDADQVVTAGKATLRDGMLVQVMAGEGGAASVQAVR